jgi:hypothetical protein
VPELSSLIDPLRSSPALPVGHPFQIATADAFWTSTRYYPELYPHARRFVKIWAGTIGAVDGAAFPLPVWCVRGPGDASR